MIRFGKTVWIAQPDSMDHKKTDFNDLLNHGGLNAILETISHAKNYQNASDTSLRNLIHFQPTGDFALNQLEKEEAKIEKLCEKFINQKDTQYFKESDIPVEEKTASLEDPATKLSDKALTRFIQSQSKEAISIHKETDSQYKAMDEMPHHLEQEL